MGASQHWLIVYGERVTAVKLSALVYITSIYPNQLGHHDASEATCSSSCQHRHILSISWCSSVLYAVGSQHAL